MRLQRDLKIALACHHCSIGDTGQDIGFLQARILIKDVMDCPATRQKVQNERHPDAMSANTRLAKADVWINKIRDSNSVLVMAHFLYGYQQGISTYLMGIVPISCTSVRPGRSQDIPLIQPDV